MEHTFNNIVETTKLIVLRGPSGSGKTSVAHAIRDAETPAVPMAVIEQDYFRRTVLKEKDIPNGKNIALIKDVVLYCLNHSYHVIMEGIFDCGRYEPMFQELLAIHPHNNFFFYFDISLEATLKRHATKPNKDSFGEQEMRQWYKKNDLLHCTQESIIPEEWSLEESVRNIIHRSGLNHITSSFAFSA
ncbi:MAG: kinase [Candidatus Kerfeldbacteria bacterium]|nr:kinase [Candidatus Kerfeldbacteria bacterium]